MKADVIKNVESIRLRLLNFLKGLLRFKKKPICVSGKSDIATEFEKLPVEVKEAIKTISMAANKKGESFETIEARIREEAKACKEFLESDAPIMKVKVVIKNPNESNNWIIDTENLRYPNPVLSSERTLKVEKGSWVEYWYVDENGNSPFSFLRLPCDRTSSKTIDLGKGRKFTGEIETSRNGFINMKAEFAPGDAAFLNPVLLSTDVQEPPKTKAASSGFSFTPIFAFASGVVITTLFFSLLWWVTFNSSQQPDKSPSSNVALNKDEDEIENPIPVSDRQQVGETTVADTNQPNAAKKKSRQTIKEQRAKRLSKINQLYILIDAQSCNLDNRCVDLLAAMERQFGTDLKIKEIDVKPFENIPLENGAAQLTISYKPEDNCIGFIHLKLMDGKGLVWEKSVDCHKFGEGNRDAFVTQASTNFANSLSSSLQKARKEFPSDKKHSGKNVDQGGE
jgi:hypothetical protein